jgi:DNA helicase HerA-like ATPase
MSSPIEFTASQVVGVVESVSPSEITVRVEQEAPQATALNAGHVQRFPRINTWVLIPSEVGYLVGTVTWIGIDRNSLSPQIGRRDQSLVDLPYPVRRMKVTPLGTLRWRSRGPSADAELLRGILSYPSVGESVLVPTPEQVRAVARGDDKARVPIGTSPLAGDVTVHVDPDKLFGRHLAILGNTGSGKSCTVAGLIRWSMEAAVDHAAEDPDSKVEGAPNARFIVLDPNGEYASAFKDLPGVRVVNVSADGMSNPDENLKVPAWTWNSDEWSAILGAGPGVQRPVLQAALREIRGGSEPRSEGVDRLYRVLRGYLHRFRELERAGLSAYSGFPGSKNFGEAVSNCHRDLSGYESEPFLQAAIDDVLALLAQVRSERSSQGRNGVTYWSDFPEENVHDITSALETVVALLPGGGAETSSVNIDAPIKFQHQQLAEHIEFLAHEEDFASFAQHVTPMVTRLRTLMRDERIRPVIATEEEGDLKTWLETYLGSGESQADPGSITVVNLSLVPNDVLHTCVSVIARLIFEALQRYRKIHAQELPTVLVLEEAHTFVTSRALTEGESHTPRAMCRHVFERIAREGRKFGLSLVLSSQRPSELSPTVLAQCNSFLLHRLVNDADQELVRRLVPDALGDLLSELPSLPSRQAVLLGWASVLPTLVEIGELDLEHRPRSSDPQYWDVWTGSEERPSDWTTVLDDWLG